MITDIRSVRARRPQEKSWIVSTWQMRVCFLTGVAFGLGLALLVVIVLS